MILRASNFFGYAYADEISEKSFYAKNFKAILKDNCLQLSFEFTKGLDFNLICLDIKKYTFFEIEDTYLKNKLIRFLNNFPQVKKIQLIKNGHPYSVKRIKITTKGFLLQLL